MLLILKTAKNFIAKKYSILFLAIYTAAMDMLLSSDSSNVCRKPDIMADAVYALLCKDSKSVTGKFLIDEDILKNEGITDFTNYACNPGNIGFHFCYRQIKHNNY